MLGLRLGEFWWRFWGLGQGSWIRVEGKSGRRGQGK